MKIPEFVLKKLYVSGSFKTTTSGFSFDIHNTFAPATVTGVGLDVDGVPAPTTALTLQLEGHDPYPAVTLSPQSPFFLPINVLVHFLVQSAAPRQGRLTIHVITREAGELVFAIQTNAAPARVSSGATPDRAPAFTSWLRRRQGAYPVEMVVDAASVVGEINPYIYGHFVEHLERCVYDGIWTQNGALLREDTLALVHALRPPVIRYPGGNFASGYHWEDGVGPRHQREKRFDPAWQAWESNMVGTDEFMDFCNRVGSDAFMVVNDGSGSPEEAARWVAYCNDAYGQASHRRAANGHPAAYNVSMWGVGNEVWGEWQVGHTDAASYALRAGKFISAMRAADPTIRIVVVGNGILSDDPADVGRGWNEAVLRQLGDQIDAISFHIYTPGEEGWRERYDPYDLHHLVCAAPLSIETMIRRMAAQAAILAPWRKIGVALDEWNLQFPPVAGAASMHYQPYTMRDALYVAGMLNAFQRQCNDLVVANLAQLVNVLPLIVTTERRAFATPLYYPFQLYSRMERLALQVQKDGLVFNTDALGNVAAQREVPYLDATATCDPMRQKLVLGLINRHPDRKARVTVRLHGFEPLAVSAGWLLAAPDALAANTEEDPTQVQPRVMHAPAGMRDHLTITLPPACLAVVTMKASDLTG